MVQPGNEVTNLVMVVKSIAKVEILLYITQLSSPQDP